LKKAALLRHIAGGRKDLLPEKIIADTEGERKRGDLHSSPRKEKGDVPLLEEKRMHGWKKKNLLEVKRRLLGPRLFFSSAKKGGNAFRRRKGERPQILHSGRKKKDSITPSKREEEAVVLISLLVGKKGRQDAGGFVGPGFKKDEGRRLQGGGGLPSSSHEWRGVENSKNLIKLTLYEKGRRRDRSSRGREKEIHGFYH